MNRSQVVRPIAAIILTATVLTGCASTGATEGGPIAASSGTAGAITSTELQNLGFALSEQGREGPYREFFGSLELDDRTGTVTLYATDDGKARDMVDAGKAAHPGIDTGRVRIAKCRYARADIDSVLDAIMRASDAHTLPYVVHQASAAPGASGVQVATDKGGAASPEMKKALEGIAGSMPVTVAEGQAVHNLDATAQPSKPSPS
ncbi:hypothetical protein [Kitasatospora sp. NBC_01539]|uniref:hypothetical protein n=1 Tax=Kitasatospora sp. NBC_01539 TaxID=2903577 RepID=UPI0038601A0C